MLRSARLPRSPRRLALLGAAALGLGAACGDDVTTTAAASDGASDSAASGETSGGDTTAGPPGTSGDGSTGSTGGASSSSTTSASATASSSATSSETSTGAATSEAATTDGGTETGGQADCDYPILWPAELDAEAMAEAALAALSPGATLDWHADRGTVKYIGALELVIDCEDETPLWDAVFAFLESQPALFQLHGDQWLKPVGTQCLHVDASPTTYNTSRAELGDWAVFRDVVNVRLYRNDDDQVVMQSMGGVYLPAMPEDIKAQIHACLDQGPAQETLEQAVRDEWFPYVSYLGANQICQPAIMGSYHAAPDDAVELTAAAQVDWYENGEAAVVVTVDQRAELIVAPANVTDELAASNAACPEEMGDGVVVGFFAYLDLITAAISSKGAGLGCVVC